MYNYKVEVQISKIETKLSLIPNLVEEKKKPLHCTNLLNWIPYFKMQKVLWYWKLLLGLPFDGFINNSWIYISAGLLTRPEPPISWCNIPVTIGTISIQSRLDKYNLPKLEFAILSNIKPGYILYTCTQRSHRCKQICTS